MELPLPADKQKQRDSLNAELEVKKEELATMQKEANRNYKKWTQQKLEVTKRRNLSGECSLPPRQFRWW